MTTDRKILRAYATADEETALKKAAADSKMTMSKYLVAAGLANGVRVEKVSKPDRTVVKKGPKENVPNAPNEKREDGSNLPKDWNQKSPAMKARWRKQHA